MFDGSTFDEERDGERIASQLDRVWLEISDGKWHTLAELATTCGGTEASVSARIRDFRKPKFGGHTIAREYVARGLWKYRLVIA